MFHPFGSSVSRQHRNRLYPVSIRIKMITIRRKTLSINRASAIPTAVQNNVYPISRFIICPGIRFYQSMFRTFKPCLRTGGFRQFFSVGPADQADRSFWGIRLQSSQKSVFPSETVWIASSTFFSASDFVSPLFPGTNRFTISGTMSRIFVMLS